MFVSCLLICTHRPVYLEVHCSETVHCVCHACFVAFPGCGTLRCATKQAWLLLEGGGIESRRAVVFLWRQRVVRRLVAWKRLCVPCITSLAPSNRMISRMCHARVQLLLKADLFGRLEAPCQMHLQQNMLHEPKFVPVCKT